MTQQTAPPLKHPSHLGERPQVGLAVIPDGLSITNSSTQPPKDTKLPIIRDIGAIDILAHVRAPPLVPNAQMAGRNEANQQDKGSFPKETNRFVFLN